MAFEPLEFTKNWENPEDFPAYEPDERQVRADLQRLHEETRQGLNRLIAALNDSGAAGQLPFLPTGDLTAQTVQAAIEEVYAAVKDAAAGQLVDGTVSKNKLTQQLLERIYGGRVWASMDSPTAADGPEQDFPVGQLWLRGGFTVDNLALAQWSASGCTLSPNGDGWLLTADGGQETVQALQILERVGKAGERIWVRLQVPQKHSHLSELALYLNDVEHDLMEGGGVFETELDQSGSLEVMIWGAWPYAEAGATVTLSALSVVSADASAAQGCRPLSDWPAFLENAGAFDRITVEPVVYLQTAPGQWLAVDQPVLPVDRGGTGRTAFSEGGLVCGGADGGLNQVARAAETDSLLTWDKGKPQWMTMAQLDQKLGTLHGKSGTYSGSGADRNIELGCNPLLLRIWKEGSVTREDGDNGDSLLLFNGESGMKQTSVSWDMGSQIGNASCFGYVTLNGSQLQIYDVYEDQRHTKVVGYFNISGATYRWLAIYGGEEQA